MLVQDNQQVTDINSWICGILEGEGDFSNRNGGYRVRISNTDNDIIKVCENYLKTNNIYFATYTELKSGYTKIIKRINISALRNEVFNYPKIFYDLLDQHLQCRRNEFELMLGTSTTVRPLSIDKSWLAGIWEAEGTFSLIFRTYKGNIRTNFAISLGNSNKKIIDKIALNLNSLWCGYHISSPEIKENRKPFWRIEICGMLRCQNFLNRMKNYWLSSRNQRRSELMLEFIESRLEAEVRSPYTPRQKQIVQTMTDLNR